MGPHIEGRHKLNLLGGQFIKRAMCVSPLEAYNQLPWHLPETKGDMIYRAGIRTGDLPGRGRMSSVGGVPVYQYVAARRCQDEKWFQGPLPYPRQILDAFLIWVRGNLWEAW